MSTSPFSDPAEPSGLDYSTLNGSLLMIEVLSAEDHVPTIHSAPGERNPAIRANVTVLDGAQAGTINDDCMIFPKVLVGQLRSRVGKLVLGRLGQGEQQAGKNAPWKLFPATDQDRQMGERALATIKGSQQNQNSGPTTIHQSPPPAPPQQAPLPAAGGWGAGGSAAPPPQQPARQGWGAPAGQPPSEPPF